MRVAGGVEAAIGAATKGTVYPGHIPSLTKALRPAVLAVEKQPGDLLMNATRENVRRNVGRTQDGNAHSQKSRRFRKSKSRRWHLQSEDQAVDFL